MSDTYPRMLYRKPGNGDGETIHGLACEMMLAEGPEHEGMVHADGWRRTPAEAHGQAPEVSAEASSGQAEVAQLRAELQAAAELVADLNQRIEALTAERDEAVAQVSDLTAPEPGKRQRQKETADA